MSKQEEPDFIGIIKSYDDTKKIIIETKDMFERFFKTEFQNLNQKDQAESISGLFSIIFSTVVGQSDINKNLIVMISILYRAIMILNEKIDQKDNSIHLQLIGQISTDLIKRIGDIEATLKNVEDLKNYLSEYFKDMDSMK